MVEYKKKFQVESMEPKEKNSYSEVRSNNKISLIILLLSLVFFGLLYVLYLSRQDTETLIIKEFLENTLIELGKGSEDKVINQISGYENSAFIVYRDYLVECNSQSIRFMNKQGNSLWEHQVKINKPLMKVSGKSLIIADMGGREIYAVNGSYIDWEKKFDENIINVDVNSSGYVVVVKEAKGLKGAVTLFDSKGNEIFTKGYKDMYIMSAEISPDNSSIVVNNFNTSGLAAYNSFEFLDMRGKTIAGVSAASSLIFPAVSFINKNHILVSGDAGVACYKTDGSLVWSNNFNGRKIYSSGVLENNYAVVAVSGENKPGTAGGNKPEILVLNSEGEITARVNIDSEIININTYSDMIAVNTGRGVNFINRKGQLLGAFSSKTDIKNIYFFSRLEAAVITRQGATIVKTH